MIFLKLECSWQTIHPQSLIYFPFLFLQTWHNLFFSNSIFYLLNSSLKSFSNIIFSELNISCSFWFLLYRLGWLNLLFALNRLFILRWFILISFIRSFFLFFKIQITIIKINKITIIIIGTIIFVNFLFCFLHFPLISTS